MDTLAPAYPGQDPCITKAKPGEPQFMLLGRDPVAASLVCLWAAVRAEAQNIKPTAPDRIADAMVIAEHMAVWCALDGREVIDVLDYLPLDVLASALGRRGHNVVPGGAIIAAELRGDDGFKRDARKMLDEDCLREFERDLSRLLNRHGIDSRTNTPDFILAEFLADTLPLFDRAHVKRRFHAGRGDARPVGAGDGNMFVAADRPVVLDKTAERQPGGDDGDYSSAGSEQGCD